MLNAARAAGPETLEDGLAAADERGEPADGDAVPVAVGHGIGQDHLGQEREVRIVRLAVAVGVPVYAHEILIVLKRDEPGGVGAERARLVVVTLRLYKKRWDRK